ncbi:NAD(P)-binding protein [Hesseltinella vesiculosa]|uniref:Very-long-chain 3-oxoacyl-CoA reductase n=1 Tax=Hesseltinella vesiculosa TaxID=101127 RepID=A0A1X2G8T2_9FUNG|nr:NAD(P)-binding protein [Hesseltinella vesiculosa]
MDSISDPKLFAVAAAFSLVGLAFVSTKLASFVKALLDLYVFSGIPLKKFGAGNGAWAVITGATDGIGKEFARQLANKKFNVLLVSRTLSKLETVAAEITTESGMEVKVFTMDFAKGDPQDFARLGDLIQTLNVGVLVNNVGTNHDFPTPFAEEADQVIDNIIQVNVKGAMSMTKLVLPQMLEKKNGLILNLGSFAGLVATPYLSVYSAGKAFLSTWSQAIGTELRPQGILVEHVNTYFVVSAMSKIRKPTALIPLAKPYVASVLAKIGLPCGADVPFTSTPYPTHGLVNWVINNVFSKTFWVNKNDSIQRSIRKRALRKREREAAAAHKTN